MFEQSHLNDIPAREEEVLKFWKESSIFEKSVSGREGAPIYSTYDGPPFATGLPHYGHILAGTIKDVVLRFKTMEGFQVPRRFGWDCHGLPVENEIEKAKNLSGAQGIETFGIASFNEECRSIVLRYTEEWKSTVERTGRWVDFTKTYRTMDKSFMESVWWVFGQLFVKGLIYEGFKVMPFSAKLGTPLSNFEANLNYQDVDDPSLTLLFALEGEVNTYFMAWTTTPWTLPSNLALGVGPEMSYVKILEVATGRHLILSASRLSFYFKEGSYEVLETFTGKQLAGKRYIPLFDYFVAQRADAFRVLADSFVSDADGTGIVQLAPAFGEQDFIACQAAGIEHVCPIDANCHFTHEVKDFEGQFVKDADKEIIRRLKASGNVFLHTQIRHRYPMCWRSDTPLIYRTITTWFVAVEKIKEQLLASNEQITWVPNHIKHGRFGKWLENARDWAISRNRFWGTPMPIWRSASGKVIVVNSIADLEARTGKKISDLHRHFIDDLTFTEEGELYKRVPEVFDCWFESGSMPYAQNHYPFENKELTEQMFPAEFIAEGLDQTRGWFYTLNVLSTALFGTCAAKNVIVNGIVLAEDGNKMSKRLKNYPQPEAIISQYGADALRLYLLRSPAVVADDMRFSEEGVKQVVRSQLIPLWNSYVFLATYAKIYNWHPAKTFSKPAAVIDRWILSRLHSLIASVETGMKNYTLNAAVEPFVAFIDELTNWYIRRCRARFWSAQDTQDRQEAFQTLYTVLITFTKMTASFIPFISDAIYQQLRQSVDPLSCHLCDLPKVDATLRDLDLEQEMAYVQEVTSHGHALRKEHKLKVRQPLSSAYLITADPEKIAFLKRGQSLICDELNVKNIIFEKDEKKFVSLQIKPNFKTLGKKVGDKMKAVQAAILQLPFEEGELLQNGKAITLLVDGHNLELLPEDVTIERKALTGLVASTTSSGITVALDTTITNKLLIEGIAREFVNKINTMRREQDFAVQDRIEVEILCPEMLETAFKTHQNYICEETLTTKVSFVSILDGQEWEIEGANVRIDIKRSSNQ